MEDENIEYNDKTCIIIETFDENNNNNTENNLSQKLREYSSKNKFNESHIHIYYMFYSKDNPIIAKNILEKLVL